MRQAVEAARYGSPPPPDLQLGWWCGDYRLPDTGGVLDQDGLLWKRIQSLMNAYRLAHKVKGLVGDSIHSLSPSERVAIKYLMKNGIW